MTGKKSRPRTQPINRGGNRNYFLISSGFESIHRAEEDGD